MPGIGFVVVAVLAGITVFELVHTIGERLWGTPPDPRNIPEDLKVSLSEHDEEMADKTQELIREVFVRDGQTVTQSIAGMSKEERLEAAKEFAGRVVALYGLDNPIILEATLPNGTCGFYNGDSNEAHFALSDLMWDANDRHFEAHVLNFLDTIVHEERHAVQIRAIRERGFWQVDDQRRRAWAGNMPPNYISPETDIRGYMYQPLERDAVTFANRVVGGIN